MKSIGIIGNGFVGSAIVSGFSLHADIKIYDAKPELSTHSLSEVVNESQYVFIGVPTPMKTVTGGEIVLDIMDSVFRDIASIPKHDNFSYDNVIFIIKSTVVPGTVERYQKMYPELKIVFNPEFLTERSARLDFINSSRIVLGGSSGDVDSVESLYRSRFPYKPIIKTDVATAQFIKYMCNCFFSVKVSFMNEMKQAAQAGNINWNEAMAGFVSDGRIGNSHLDVPGHDGSHGFGGKCFPKDLNAFIHYFKLLGVNPAVMLAAWEKNMEVRENHDWLDIEGAVDEV
mgnify:CR=1 FL=1